MSFFDDGQFFYGTEEAQNSTWTPPFFDDGQFGYGTEEAQNSTSPFFTDEVKKRLNKIFYTILITLIYVTSLLTKK